MSKEVTRNSVPSKVGTGLPSSSGKITKEMTFAEIMELDSEAGRKLAERGLFCGGCPMAAFESLENGAKAHGVDADELVEELNSDGD